MCVTNTTQASAVIDRSVVENSREREDGDGDGEENEETRERNTMTNGTKGNGRKMRANQLAGWNKYHGFVLK